jgi:preprotein translocase subunit SecE
VAGFFAKLAWTRPGQGKWPRFLTGASAISIGLFGCLTLYDALAYDEFMYPVWRIPGIDFELTWPLMISGIVFILCMAGTYLLVNSRRIVDFLLDTEGEVRKVSWPGWNEVVGSSIVVIFTVIVLSIYIALADYIFNKLMGTFVYG